MRLQAVLFVPVNSYSIILFAPVMAVRFVTVNCITICGYHQSKSAALLKVLCNLMKTNKCNRFYAFARETFQMCAFQRWAEGRLVIYALLDDKRLNVIICKFPAPCRRRIKLMFFASYIASMFDLWGSGSSEWFARNILIISSCQPWKYRWKSRRAHVKAQQ